MSLEKLKDSPFAYGAIMTAARALPVITVFVASFVLDAGDFGIVAVLITAVTVATLIADSGTDNAAGWLASRAPTAQARVRFLAALVYTRVVVAVVAVVILVSPLIGDAVSAAEGQVLAVVLAAAGSGLAAFNAARRVSLRIAGHGEPAAMLREKFAISLIFGLALLVMEHTAEQVVFGYLTACFLGPLIAFKPVPRRELRPSRAAFAGLLGAAAPFIITTLCAAAIWRASTFLLGHFGKYDEAGYLTLAYLPIQALVSIPGLAAPLLLIKRGRYAEGPERQTVIAFVLGSVLGLGGLLALGLLRIVSGNSFLAAQTSWSLVVLLSVMPLLWLNPILMARIRLSVGPWLPAASQSVIAILAIAAAIPVLRNGGAVEAAALIAACEVVIVITMLRWLRVSRGRADAEGNEVVA